MTKTIRKVSRIDGQTPRKFGGSNKPSKSRWWWPFADRISLAELNPFIFIPKLLFDPAYFYTFGILILIAETIICPLIIRTRTYTEIDWVAYMGEVEGFLNGTWDYQYLKGQTGALVYPAGFVYIYSALYFITNSGKNILLAQYIFSGLYLLNLFLVIRIYHKSGRIPPFVLALMTFGAYRIHSIFILRLFNDPIAILICNAAILLILNRKFSAGCFVFSLAVSVKMNILLFAPAVLVILLANLGYVGTFFRLSICAAVQISLGAPFLLTNPFSYISRGFDFGRQFFFIWTVNWRFLPEEIFLDRKFQISLLIGHLTVLIFVAFRYWFRPKFSLIRCFTLKNSGMNFNLNSNDILFALFSSNFIGICFARSLHYQFYVWYFYSLPYLLWNTSYGTPVRLTLLGLMEICWNIYPSTNESSLLLHTLHFLILVGFCANFEKIRRQEEKTLKKF